jgi:Flp pilus assembly protein TadD
MRSSRARDGADGQPGFDGMAALDVQNPEGHFIGWAPGRGPVIAPQGMPWRLEPGTDLVVELHLLPGKSTVAVDPLIGLFFATEPPARVPVMVVMGSKSIDIPAGQRDYVITDTYVLPADVELLSVYPHAHYLGKEMHVMARAPDGTMRTLLHIPRWSFHWQQDYRYVTPITLRRGTAIIMRYTYDNSAENEENPHHPPIGVTWGPQSTDEMGNLGMQLLPRADADRAVLVKEFALREAQANVASGEMLVKHYPDNAVHRTSLGSSYLEVGRLAEAIAQLEVAVRLDPGAAQARNFLGGALLAAGRHREALTHLRQASALAPKDAYLHFNVGKALKEANQPSDAIRELDRALALNADFAEAHNELGVILFERGRLADALVHLGRAVELAPTSAIAHSDYGGALAQAGRRDEALQHIRRALALDPQNAAARENLSRFERSR